MKPHTILPQPSPDAYAHSQRVRAYIEELLAAQNNWLSLHDYIDAALYAPGLGYYASGAKKLSGNNDGSDFVTAPELTPLFARVWGKPIAEALVKASQANIFELGAGSGAFAEELLTTLFENDISFSSYAILERSADLRARQQQILQEHTPQFSDRIVWLDHLPDAMAGVVFMNEVLDALSPHVVLRKNGQWFEQGVMLNDARQLAYMDKPLADEKLLNIAQSRFPESGNYQAEINLDAEILMETLARALCASGGNNTLFVCDYGFERNQTLPERYSHGTLRAYYRHHLLDDLFVYPGLIDITAHIDFVAMLEAARRGGMVLADFQTQRDWLIHHGILDLLCNDGCAQAEEHIITAKAAQTLIAPEAMGEIFKILTLTTA